MVEHAREQTSGTCRGCHADIHAAWSVSDHALANRPVNTRDEAAFSVAASVEDGGSRFELGWKNSRGLMTELCDDDSPRQHTVELILGSKPLWQPLLAAEGGRWQPADLAFDPERREWFNVFGQENRRRGEWGHWSGLGMNWNSMCAHCHMTGFQKNYFAETDSYQSTWVEHGVGCIQCHGPVSSGHPANATGKTLHLDRARMMQTCAPCHARNELLTGGFQPGDDYHDHYRVVLPVDPAAFYPDGQQRDEVFNWTSVLLSRMGHAGVTCVDCHDPHSNRTILPKTDNNLCLQCHGTPGRVLANGSRAMSIDPLAHSKHAPGSAGNLCISCHMPVTHYMQRAPRHDHGWLKPDPLLTQELGVPNACNRCHVDETVQWAIDHAETWYGAKLDSHQRRRTRAVAAAQSGHPSAVESLLSILPREEVAAWRAALLELARPYVATSPPLRTIARESLSAKDPLERAAAARLLADSGEPETLLAPLLHDPVRVVRLQAAWALSPMLPDDSPVRAELDAYLALAQDQPGGRLQRGEDLANRGFLAEAEKEMRLSATWDPHSPAIRNSLGWVLLRQKQPLAAAKQFRLSADLQPASAEAAYHAALSYAEAGRMSDAEQELRRAVARNPRFDRAWYNLGLLLAQTGRLAEAATFLQGAESLAPQSAAYPYALATVLLRAGDPAGAAAAARRVLSIDPGHPGARAVWERAQSSVQEANGN